MDVARGGGRCLWGIPSSRDALLTEIDAALPLPMGLIDACAMDESRSVSSAAAHQLGRLALSVISLSSFLPILSFLSEPLICAPLALSCELLFSGVTGYQTVRTTSTLYLLPQKI
jgi:hypothetical protein